MNPEPLPTLLLVLDLIGTFVFALNGALTAVRAARLDVVGVSVSRHDHGTGRRSHPRRSDRLHPACRVS